MSTADASEPIKILDLFAGCGGFTQGFHSYRPTGREGDGSVFRTVAAVEFDLAAAATYAANFASGMGGAAHIHAGNIEDWYPKDDEVQADVILGGPPCQGFSGLGRRDENDPRNKLWRQYVRIINDIEPKVFVIENVDRFLRSPEFHELVEETRPGGELERYRLVDPPGAVEGEPLESRANRYLLNSANYGVPQKRRRAIVIGVRRDIPALAGLEYPAPTHGDVPAQEALFRTGPTDRTMLPWNTVEQIFAQSKHLRINHTELPARSIDIPEIGLSIPGEVRRRKIPGTFTTTDLHIGRNPEVLSQARYLAIKTGENRKSLTGKYYKVDRYGKIHLSTDDSYRRIKAEEHYLSTDSWDGHNSGSGDVMGRLVLERPSVTIRTEFYKPEKGRYLHPSEHRPITHFEAALIQGFPLDFKWRGTKVEIARQIGNAVPVGLGRAIAGVIHRSLRG